MQVEALDREAAARDGPVLTTSEFRQLGLSRIGYLMAVIKARGDTDIVIQGADGLTVARADSVDNAMDLADQLGLTLVPVH